MNLIFVITTIIGVGYFIDSWAATDSGSVDINMTVSVSAMCGDNIINEGEVCDGGSASCTSISSTLYGCGTASCKADCSGWQVSTCRAVGHPDCNPCFLPDTKILLANNSSKRIADIVVGDLVYSYDEQSKQLQVEKVLQKFQHDNVPGYLVVNNFLKVTPNHRLYINGAWQEAGELHIGDSLQDEHGQMVKVRSLRWVDSVATVYNFEVSNIHNYFADGILAHNCKGDCEGPTITIISTSTSYTTANVVWTAYDGASGLQNCSFSYSGPAATVNQPTAGNFNVNLSGLSENTSYSFTITCTDSSNNGSAVVGTFRTLAPWQALSIYNVVVRAGMTTTSVTWNTNKDSDSQINYGLTSAYGSMIGNSTLLSNHSQLVSNLCGNTTYHYEVVSAVGDEQVRTSDDTFTTLLDMLNNPTNVSEFGVVTTSRNCALSWINPDQLSEACFAGVEVVRKLDVEPTGHLDGVLVYDGIGQTYTDSGISANKNYYYKIFTKDTSDNYSTGAKVFCKVAYCGDSLIDVAGEECDNGGSNGVCPEACSMSCKRNVCENEGYCGDGEPDAGENCEPNKPITRTCAEQDANWNSGVVTCNNNCTYNYSGCSHIGGGNCGDGNLDVSAGETCDHGSNNGICPSTCSATCQTQVCPVCGDGTRQGAEDCDNGALNGCGISSCASDCTLSCGNPQNCGNGTVDIGEDCETNLPITKSCGDFNIDWNEGVVRCNSNCSFNTTDCRRGITVPGFVHLNLSDLLFWGGARNIELRPDTAGVVRSLVRSAFTVGVPRVKLAGPPIRVALRFGNNEYALNLDNEQKTYYTDIVFPNGDNSAFLEIDYGSGQTDSVNFKLSSLPTGVVTGDGGVTLEGVNIKLYNDKGELFNADYYGQLNPLISDRNGVFGWVVPNGKYYLALDVDRYYSHKTQRFLVTNNVVNRQVRLTMKPATIAAAIPANIERAVEVIKETVDNPVVEQAATQIVAPAAVGVVAVGTVSLISFSNLWAFLQLLFFQPILLIGRRKRKNWGQVYNSLSKMPVDLAIVRLVDAVSGKIIRSRVTDKNGRYIFIADPGKYKIEAFKAGFVSPTKLLVDFKSDGRRTDLYHGEVIEVTVKDTTITANIPMDPAGESKTPRRLYVERVLRHVQILVSWTGLFVTIVALYISPKWYMWVLLGVHIVLFLLFRRLAVMQKAKGWGIVYDEHTKKPLDRAVARLFDSHFNKLVSTEITDRNGRYTFLAADSQFYVTYERPGYEQAKTEDIDLRGQDAAAIALDVALKKADGLQSPPNKPTPTSTVSTGDNNTMPDKPVDITTQQ